MIRNTALLPLLAFLISSTACSNVGVGADNRYGYSRGEAVVKVPIESVADGLKAATTSRPPQIEGPLSAQVVSVHGGDTLTVLIDGHKENVRLIGIDAPELDQAPWGVVSRDTLKSIIDGMTVRIETDVQLRDQYKRLLAYVYVNDTFVNLVMVRLGQAVLYTVAPNVMHVDEYRKAEEEARQAGRGVWNPTQPLDVAPDCYRKRQKGREC
ncbi:MAG TPA: thermonuclease family protein [Nitrospiraceae bacterium]|nr:thermonuclease family protein [Nitrospiraceae bacterium]